MCNPLYCGELGTAAKWPSGCLAVKGADIRQIDLARGFAWELNSGLNGVIITLAIGMVEG